MTLGEWRDAWAAVFGEGGATAYLDGKIETQGRDVEVLADEQQFTFILTQADRS